MNSNCPLSAIADHVFVINHTRYRTRQRLIRTELERLGVDSYEFIVQFPNPLDSRLLRRDDRLCNIWMGHYRALKLGYELGYDKIMVIEDDIAFLRDTHEILVYTDDLRDRSYSMLHLDPVVKDVNQYRMGIKLGHAEGFCNWGIYRSHPLRWLRSGGCYCFTRDGMAAMIKLCEESACATPPHVEAMDMMYNYLVDATGKPILYASPNLAVQRNFSDDQKGRYTQFAQSTYFSMGIDTKLYNIG